MVHDLALIVLGVVLATPIAFIAGSKHEKKVAAAQRLYIRRVTNARTTVARPGTTVSTVRVASLSRPVAASGNDASPRK